MMLLNGCVSLLFSGRRPEHVDFFAKLLELLQIHAVQQIAFASMLCIGG